MKKTVLNRYPRSADGSIVIDVTASRLEDLYDDFDKNAPFIRRELEPSLVDYLIGCVRELVREPFLINFTLAQPPDDTKLLRIQRSINGYFLYLIEIEKNKVLEMFRRAAILFGIGLAILFTSVWVNQWLGEERSVVANVFAEGLTVAAWVSLWEALAVFLIEWFPHRKNIIMYRRLAEAQLTFNSKMAEDTKDSLLQRA